MKKFILIAILAVSAFSQTWTGRVDADGPTLYTWNISLSNDTITWQVLQIYGHDTIDYHGKLQNPMPKSIKYPIIKITPVIQDTVVYQNGYARQVNKLEVSPKREVQFSVITGSFNTNGGMEIYSSGYSLFQSVIVPEVFLSVSNPVPHRANLPISNVSRGMYLANGRMVAGINKNQLTSNRIYIR